MAGIEDEWQEGEGKRQTFLLRCWQEDDCLNGAELNVPGIWRFVVVEVNGRDSPKCFASLEELVVHLRGRLSQVGRDTAESLGETFGLNE